MVTIKLIRCSNTSFDHIDLSYCLHEPDNQLSNILSKIFKLKRNQSRSVRKEICNHREQVFQVTCKLLRANCQSQHQHWTEVCKVVRKRTSGLTVVGRCLYASYWRRDHHFYMVIQATRRSSHLQRKSAKAVPSFLSYFKTLRIGVAPGIKPTTSCSACQILYQLS